jgi:TonB family protein
MPRPDPTGAKSSNSVKPDSWKLGPELVHRFESDHRDDQTRVAIDPADSELLAREVCLAAGQQDFGDRRRDFRTGALTAAIIALSLLLGWMVGRAGWSMAVQQAEIQSPDVPENLAAAQVIPEPLPVSTSAEELTDGQSMRMSSPAVSPLKLAPKVKIQAAEPNGGLMIFEHDKVAFREAPSEAKPQTEGNGDSDSQTASNQIPPATSTYLIKRVVPKYPEQAKQLRVQGPVVLNTLVGRDGSVQEVKVISGDPELVQAAVEAVKQWHFQPQWVQGNPVEFETRITVNFSLPQVVDGFTSSTGADQR